MSDDAGRRCPRCDCPDGHEQCDHCKVCPHAERGAGGAPREKPRASVIEIIAPDFRPTDDGAGSIVVPKEVRINGVSVYTAGDGVVRISEVDLGDNLVTVNLTLVVRRLTIAADGDFQQAEPNKGIPITRAAQAHLGGCSYDYRGTSGDEPPDEEAP